MKKGIKFIMGEGIEDVLQIQDLDEAKEYLKDVSMVFCYLKYIYSLESALITIFNKISAGQDQRGSKYKIWLDAYYELRQEEQEKEIKNSTTTESRLIKQATDDLLDVIVNNKSFLLNDDVIMDKAYFLKDLINLIKKEDSHV